MDRRLKQILIGLCILGLAVSAYMTVYKLTSNKIMCLGSGDCSVVNASSYSEVYKIPVAVVGMGGYLALLAVLLLEPRTPFLKQNAPLAFFGLALTGWLFTIYLIYVEAVLIKAFCPFCITSQVTMTLIFFLSILVLVRQPNS